MGQTGENVNNTKEKDAEVAQTSQEQILQEQEGKTKKKSKHVQEIERLSDELEAQKEQYMRVLAEYDNFRKRTQTEKSGIYTQAVTDAVKSLLPIADSIERALEQEGASAEDMQKGVELIFEQIKASFESLGVSSVGVVGESFDPNLHDAVSHIEDEAMADGVISAVFQKGYRIGEKIVRHAMVQVAN